MVYSNKYNESVQFKSHKIKSNTHFHQSTQNFEKGGIIFTDEVIATKKKGSNNYRLRPNFKLSGHKTSSDRLSSYNFSETDIKQNIQNSNCHNEKHHLLNLQSNLTKDPTNSSLQSQVQSAENNLNKCIDQFHTYYKNPDMNVTRHSSSNILPNNYPYKDTEVFGSNLNSCQDSQLYHSPIQINVPNRIENNKPVYGTKRGFDYIGPRIMNSENINRQTAFDPLNSGYNIQEINNNKPIYKPEIVENYDEHENNIKVKNYCEKDKCSLNKYNYKNKYTYYFKVH